MIHQEYSFEAFGFSSQAIRDLVANKVTVSPFVDTFFSLDNLKVQARKKRFTTQQRALLVGALQNQNKALQLSASSKANIDLLANENTVTITTGHQLNLMTGPLYSIYKVAQVISFCRHLNEQDVDFNYVPVFWMATEDHDFDEINHLHLFGQKIAWEKQGQEDKIVGEIVPEGMDGFREAIADKYRDEDLKAKVNALTAAYREEPNLAAATRRLMNELFADFGLVIVDGNDAELKKSFTAIAQKEIEEGFVFEEVKATNAELEQAGYHNQVFVRECNLFKIVEDGTRVRIAKEAEFKIGDRTVTKAGLLSELAESPQSFSPNALLRPVYQETVLPNIAYVGGGGEIAYWLQLKGVFKALDLDFPLLRVRDSILLLRERDFADMESLGVTIKDLKQDIDAMIKAIALEEGEIELKLDAELTALRALKAGLLEKAEQVNKGMTAMIEAEFAKMEKGIERIEGKLIKAEKGKHEQKANKLRKLQQKIYPNGGFQERYENFLPYFLSDSDFVSKIVDILTAEDESKIRIVKL